MAFLGGNREPSLPLLRGFCFGLLPVSQSSAYVPLTSSSQDLHTGPSTQPRLGTQAQAARGSPKERRVPDLTVTLLPSSSGSVSPSWSGVSVISAPTRPHPC